MKELEKKISWKALTFMCFSTLWGFGNVLNGYVYFNGMQVIIPWIFMFLLYFVPYAFMVGELGSTFKDLGGGITSWIQETTNTKLAYYAGWTYWAVHITYIASKGSGGLKALSWMIFQNASTYDSINKGYIQLATFIVLLFFCWLATRGLSPIKKLATLAGSSMFVMGILFIIMMFTAPAINPNAKFLSIDWTFKKLIPVVDLRFLSHLSILVFAVGGIEKISPYVNKMEGNSSKEFPRAIMFATLMVVISAIFGTIAMAMMFDINVINESKESFNSHVANGAYWAFQRLGEYYGVGNLFMIIYAAANAIGQFSTLLISIDAPLRMLLEDPNSSQYIPKRLLKKNDKGAYVNGIILIVILSGTIILLQMLGKGGGAAKVLQQLTKLNSVTMPMRYLWVFVAYFALRKNAEHLSREYRFVKGKGLGLFAAAWCFFVTAFCVTLGMWSDDTLQLILNVSTPFVLIALGLILPIIRKKQDAKGI